MKILIVDDDELAREMLGNAVASGGHGVETACDGLEALGLLDEVPCDLVVTDWEMSDLDGPELCCALRKSPRYRGIGIILLTSRRGSVDLADAYEAGVDHVISKPFNPDVLLERIRSFGRAQEEGADERDAKPVCDAGDAVYERSATAEAESPAPDDEVDARASDAPRTGAPIDIEDVLKRCVGNVDLLRLILGRFEARTGEEIEELAKAIRLRHAEAALHVAHRFCGLAGNVSAEALAALASQLEDLASESAFDEMAGCLARLREEVDRCVAYVPRLMEKLDEREEVGS
ncbi:MAG: hypothetical protein CMJ18_06590 [Phycisphaeraceae bacterium]|nr:hypothetical protein [Phycisphaeraceae bacterium]